MTELISFDLMLKATPSEEGGERIIYFEASNEGVDQQGERVLAKALAESASIFKAHGNIDLDHLSLLRKGTPEGVESEIGYPLDVVVNDKRTFVKAQLYKGNSRLARNANMVWESLTAISPPARWYPSVGGSVLAKSQQVDDSGNKMTVVEKVRWTNVALSRTPVNQHVGQASAAPVGVFAKSMNAFVLKGIEAGYGTDSAALVGGGALRSQSLHGSPIDYFDGGEHGALALRRINDKRPLLGRDAKMPDVRVMKSVMGFASASLGLELDEAAEMTERFFADLSRRVHK